MTYHRSRLSFRYIFCTAILAFLLLATAPSSTASSGLAATYGGPYSDIANSIYQTGDGGYIVAGSTSSFGVRAQEMLVLKFRPDGSINHSCRFISILDTSISGKDSSTTVKPTSAAARDSNASAQNSFATAGDANATANVLCPSTVVE